MIVAVSLVRMVQMAFNEIVGVAAMWNLFMSTTSPMSVFSVMRTTRMGRRTSGGIRATLGQSMFVHVSLVGTVKMPIMHIVDVPFVFDGGVPAT